MGIVTEKKGGWEDLEAEDVVASIEVAEVEFEGAVKEPTDTCCQSE